ncbi:MAG: rhodanese-like domain-containing protein [Acidimicrobiales bacterium]|jgi:rhodanese-related sulfurtransferase|nr:rhodanese-like domain-containing protein [Acidimicrobiales bacterium]MDP6902119.1 rhodanese-like domain-containing protein [Acidimicrobiales bacterium]HJL98998.1 rhodanese-like domain-containing protein [Acidimicrobiales bacterium]
MAIASVKEMVEAAKAEIDNISPEEASRRAVDEGALIVDIRDVRELQRDGAIPGAMHAPRGMLEFWVSPDSPYTNEIFGEDREFVLCCAGGMRSALSAKTLKDMGMEKISHIETGFGGWQADDMPTESYEEWKANRVR